MCRPTLCSHWPLLLRAAVPSSISAHRLQLLCAARAV
jgi:hypothetical protein